MAAIMARSTVMRSAAASARSAVAKVVAGAKPKASPSPFRIPVQQALRVRIFRSPVRVIVSANVDSMFPYHTATASALLTSLLFVSRRTYGWTIEDC